MKIRMTMGLAGPQYALAPGDEREFPRDEAVRLIEAGFAVPIAEVKVERAVKPPPERRAPVRKKAAP